MVPNLLILILVALITFLLILLIINVINKIFGNTYLSSIKENIEIIKTLFLLIIALFSFYFIDLQRQLLSRSNFEFEILKTFYKDALERDTEKRLFVVQTITLYRQNFVIPHSPLDNCLISLNQTILSNNDVKMMLAAPEYSSLVKKLFEDKSPLISKSIKTNEEVFGPLEGLNEEQIAKWKENNLVTIDLPFQIPISWDLSTATTKIIVNKKAKEYFDAVFQEIKKRGLDNKITDYGGSYAFRTVRSTKRLNSHAYGIAIDLNVLTNPFGTKGQMNAEIVAIFKENGFAWGGDWTIPDPMHFELLPTAVSEKTYKIN
jgi:hypothetical protein